MSLAKIDAIIEAMRQERYRFAPVRRTYIRKKNGKLRPLGLPTWSDKLVGEVMRLLFEAYYELRLALEQKRPPTWQYALTDLQDQLAALNAPTNMLKAYLDAVHWAANVVPELPKSA